jgi:two-component system nitrate/nitrite response regulator NarL
MRVALLGHVRVYGEAISAALTGRPEITVVACASPDAAGVTRIRRLDPDVVLVDVASAGSIAALADLATGLPGIRIVAMGILDDGEDVLACLEAGVSAYVSGDDDLPQVVETLRQTLRGHLSCSPAVTGAIFRRIAALAGQRRAVPSPEPLTPREREIAGLLAEGLSNREISHKLFIEVSTVKNHVHSILDKLQLASRADAACWYSQMRETPLVSVER